MSKNLREYLRLTEGKSEHLAKVVADLESDDSVFIENLKEFIDSEYGVDDTSCDGLEPEYPYGKFVIGFTHRPIMYPRFRWMEYKYEIVSSDAKKFVINFIIMTEDGKETSVNIGSFKCDEDFNFDSL